MEISQILNTGLDKTTLSILVGLCEQGVNPEALAEVVLELRREGAATVSQNQVYTFVCKIVKPHECTYRNRCKCI